MPGAVLDSSTPAAAITSPCLVCEIVVAPRLATTRTVSAAIASSRDIAATRPSALLTTFEVTTRMSPSSSPGPPGGERGVRDQLAPGRRRSETSGIPDRPEMVICGGHRASSWARSMAALAMAAVDGTSRMYSGRARTAMPASAGSSAAALSWSSTSHPSMRSAP